MASNIRVLVFGAHPDDDDLQCGGTAIKLSNLCQRLSSSTGQLADARNAIAIAVMV